MNTLTIARKLNERRQRPQPVVTTGEILGMLGSEGMNEALSRRWLVPDFDTGYLSVNASAGIQADIQEACRCAQCSQCACDCEQQAKTINRTTLPESLRESWEGVGIGSRPNISGGSPVAPRQAPQPSPTTSLTPDRPKTMQVGDDVSVVEDGKTYSGKIGSVGQDGRFKLSFGSNKPSKDRDYSPNEMQLLGAANA